MKKLQRGFTLIEIAVVLAIMGIIGAMLFAALRATTSSTRYRTTTVALQLADSGLGDHQLRDQPPVELREIGLERSLQIRFAAFPADRFGNKLPDDLRIRLSRKIMALTRSAPAVNGLQSAEDRLARRASRREQRAVDIEEDQLVAVGGHVYRVFSQS